MQKLKKIVAVLLILTMVVAMTGVQKISLNASSQKTPKSVCKYQKKQRSGVRVSKVKAGKKKVTVKVKITNRKKTDIYYGESFCVKKYVDGKWKKLSFDKSKGEIAFVDIAYVLPPKSSAYKTYNLSFYYSKKDLTKGKYRIYVDVDLKKKNRYATFRIK